MGPGPSDVAPSVLRALGAPTIGHLDPAFLRVMDEIRGMLREVFGTQNAMTLPISGTGSAGMETLFANLVEPGDEVLVGVHGVFGGRMAEVARRQGGVVTTVEAEWGEPLDVESMRASAAKMVADGRSISIVAVVHAETSTGVRIDLGPFGELAREYGALLLVDCVTSLGGIPVELDRHGVDAAYSGTQKCLSVPPGLSPLSLSERAVAKLRGRREPVRSWYLDLALLDAYWAEGQRRAYHHTAPVNMLFALHEGLRRVLAEGLARRYARHADLAARLREGLEAAGHVLPVTPDARLDPLTLVEIPPGLDDVSARRALLERFGLEIGGGLGKFAGRAWRIGLMGESATERHVALCLEGLRALSAR